MIIMNKDKRMWIRTLVALVVTSIFTVITATDFTWTGAQDTSWKNVNYVATSNWSGGAVGAFPNTNSDTATFTTTASPSLDASVTLNRLTINSGTGITVTISPTAAQTLTFAGVNPFIVVLSGNLVINADVMLSANLRIYQANGASLSLNGAITGTYSLAFDVPPAIVSRTTIDSNHDGKIDAIDVVFNKAMSNAQLGTWTVSGYGSPSPSWSNATTLRITFTPGSTPDTGVRPAVRYQSGTIQDLHGYQVATEGSGINALDGANPVIVSAISSVGSTALTITFSEPVASSINGTGQIDSTQLSYVDTSVNGATKITTVSQGNGLSQQIVASVDVAFIESDFTGSPDTIDVSSSIAIYDVAGNPLIIGSPINLSKPTTAITSTLAGGDWDTPSTWQGGVVPYMNDNVVIQGPVTLNQPGNTYKIVYCSTLKLTKNGANPAGTLASSNPTQNGYYTLIAVAGHQITADTSTSINGVTFWQYNAGDVTFNITAGTLTLNSPTQGNYVGGLVKQGAGTLIWNCSTYYTGGTAITQGSAQFQSGGRLDGNPLSISTGAFCTMAGNYSASSLDGGGTLTFTSNPSILSVAGGAWQGTLTESGGAQLFVTHNSGTSVWSGTNTFTGTLTLNGGAALTINGTNTLNLNSQVNIAGGTLYVAAAETIGPLTITGGNLYVNAATTIDQGVFSTSVSIPGALIGSESLTITGSSGSLDLGNNSQSLTGSVTLNGGRLQIAGSAPLGSIASLNFNGGTLALTGNANLTTTALSSSNVGPVVPSANLAAGPNAIPIIIASTSTIDLSSYSLGMSGFDIPASATLRLTGALANNGVPSTGDPTLFLLSSTSNTWAGFLGNVSSAAVGFVVQKGSGSLLVQHNNTARVSAWRSEDTSTLNLSTGTVPAALPVNGWLYAASGATVQVPTGATISLSAPLELAGTLSTGSVTWSGPIATQTGTPVISVSQGTTLTMSGDLGGSAAWTKSGLGTLNLTKGSANTLGAVTTVTQGILQIGNDNLLGNTGFGLNLNGGTLAVSNDTTSSRNVTLSATSTIDVANTKTYTLSGAISGAGVLTKTNLGTLVLSTSTNTHAGVSINGGTVQVSSAAPLGTGGVTIAGGTLSAAAGFTASTTPLAVSGAGSNVFTTTSAVIWNSAMSGSGNLTKLGSGTLTLSGTNSGYTGTVLVQGGKIQAASNSALGTNAINAASVTAGATLELLGNITISAPITIDGAGLGSTGALLGSASGGSPTLSGNLTFAGATTPTSIATSVGATLTISGQVTGTAGPPGSANLKVLGSGGSTVVLSNSNLFSGKVTTVTGANLQITSDNNLGAGINSIEFDGGTLTISGSSAVINSNRTILVTANDGIINTGTGNVFQVPQFSTIAGEDLTLNGSGALTLNNNPPSNSATIAGTLSGAAGINKIGGGTLTFSATNSLYTGPIHIDGGILKAAAAGSLGDSSGTNIVSISNGSSLAVGGFSGTIPQSILLSGNIDMTGSGAVTMSGTISLPSPGTIKNTNVGTGTLNISGIITSNPVGQSLTLTGDAGTINIISGIINANVGDVTKLGATTWQLSNASNAFTGQVLVAGTGVLDATTTGALPSVTPVDVSFNNSSCTLRISANQTVGRILSANTLTASPLPNIIIVGGKTLTTNTSTGSTYSGTISDTAGLGGGNLVKSGNGSWTLQGATTHTGTTLVSGGTLSLTGGSGSLANTSSITVTGASLTINDQGFGINRLNDAATVTLNSGKLDLIAGNSTYAETIGGLLCSSGSSNVTVTATNSTNANCDLHTINPGSGISVSNGVSLNVTRNNNGSSVARLIDDNLNANVASMTGITVGGYAAQYLKTPTLYGVIAATRQTITTGNWSASSTWLGGVVPLTDEDVTIANTVHLDVSPSVTAVSFTGSSTLDTSNGSQITIKGSVSVNQGQTAIIAVPLNVSAGTILTKQSPGTLHLTGTTLASGTIYVSAGTIALVNPGSIANAVVDVSGGATFDSSTLNVTTVAGLSGQGNVITPGTAPSPTLTVALGNAANHTFQGIISGSGGLTITGATATARQRFNGTNTFIGPTVISSGTLALSGAGSAGNGNFIGVNTSATLELLNNASVPSTQPMNLAGTMLVSGGSSIIDAAMTLTGPATISTGASAPGGRITLNGTVTLGTNQLTLSAPTTTSGGDFASNAVLTGSGGSLNVASGIWTIGSAGNNYTGSTSVSGAGTTFAVTGSITASATTVAIGALLEGTGSLAQVTVQGGGTIAPGINPTRTPHPVKGGVGVLSLTALTLNHQANLDVDLGSANDQIVLTGALTLAPNGGSAGQAVVNINTLAGYVTGSYVLVQGGATVVQTLSSLPVVGVNPGSAAVIQASSNNLVWSIDNTPPVLTAITSSNINDTYYAGQPINITLTYSKPVTLTGLMRVQLNAPATPLVTIAPGTNASFTTTWTPTISDTVSLLRLDSLSLVTDGTTHVTDGYGNQIVSVSTIPGGGNLGSTKTLFIDNQAPSITLTTPLSINIQATASLRTKLTATDNETAAASLLYQLVILPAQGIIERWNGSAWAALNINGTFTQADIDNATIVGGMATAGFVRYRHTGTSGGNDGFAFTVSDTGTPPKSSVLTAETIAIAGHPVASFNSPNVGVTLAYTETQAATAIDPSLTVTMIDPAYSALFNINASVAGTMTVQITANSQLSDQLSINLGNATGVSISSGTLTAGGVIAVDGITIATFSGSVTGGTAMTFVFNQQATPAAVNKLLSALTYYNPSQNPTALTRTITFIVTDGSAESLVSPPPNNEVYTRTVTMTLLHDSPIVQPTAVILTQGLTVTGTIQATDPKGLALTFAKTGSPETKGTFTLLNSNTGTFSYQHQVFNGLSDSVTISVSNTDGSAAPTIVTIPIIITSFDAAAPRITSTPPIRAEQGLPFSYTPAVSSTATDLIYQLIAPTDVGFTFSVGRRSIGADGTITWPNLPVPSDGTGYHRFGILIIDPTSQTATYQPILLKVETYPQGNG